MSRRQLKKISGYDETAELMKAMGVDQSDLESVKPQKSRYVTREWPTQTYLDRNRKSLAFLHSPHLTIKKMKKITMKQLKRKKKKLW